MAPLVLLTLSACTSGPGTPECRQVYTDVKYVSADLSNISQERFDLGPIKDAGEYLIEIQVGSQVIPVVVDTGSSNIILHGSPDICSSCIKQGYFDPSVSSTDQGASFPMLFVSGQGNAKQYTDNAGLTCRGDTAPVTLGVLTKNQNLETNILGLGYQALASRPAGEPPPPTFFDQLFTAFPGRFANVFTMTLCGHRPGSKIIFGSADEDVPRDALRYVSVISKKHFVVDARYVAVVGWKKQGGTWVQDSAAETQIGDFEKSQATRSIPTIIDSGATHSHFPSQIANSAIDVMKAVAASNKLKFDDSFWFGVTSRQVSDAEISKFPIFKVYIVEDDSEKLLAFEMEPDTYFKQITNSTYRAFSIRDRKGSTLNILGQSFMENFHVEHDLVNDRIGFASSKSLCVAK